AYVRFTVMIGQNTCTLGLTGFFLHFPGQASGTINFSGTYNFNNPFIQPLSVQVRLVDVAGHFSNVLTANVSQWFCGLPAEFDWSPEGLFIEPAWIVRARRRWDLAG